MHLWNPFLQTYDYKRFPCAIIGTVVQQEADGSWEIAVAERNPGHPNWVDTTGHKRGMVYFRWLQAKQTPEKPECRVIQIGTERPV